MAAKSAIEWTEATWNPVTGCSKISPGCKNCYAEKLAKRLKAMGVANYRNGFSIALHDNTLELPLKWKKPKMVFVNSMGDLFHEKVPLNFIQEVFSVMRKTSWHQFQILTKRAERLAVISKQLTWPENVWMGVSIENQDYLSRIDYLKETDAKIKFISFEPLIGQIVNLNLEEIDWVIVGGESGSGARHMKKEWVTSVRDQCISFKTPFFFKQWGGIQRKKSGRILEKRTWDEMPKKQDNSLDFSRFDNERLSFAQHNNPTSDI